MAMSLTPRHCPVTGCETSTGSRQALQKHLKNSHGDEQNIDDVIKKLERDICPKCKVPKAGIIDHLKICLGKKGGKKKACKRPLPLENQVI